MPHGRTWLVAVCVVVTLSLPAHVRADGIAHRVAALEAAVALLQSQVAGLANFRIVRGTVHGSGSSAGEGWSAVALGDGVYEVTFDPAFPAPPTVVVTVHGNRTQFTHTISIDDTAGPSGISGSGFTVFLSEGVTPGSALPFEIANPFEFVAIGPR